MGKRRPTDAGLADQDPHAMTGNAMGGSRPMAFPNLWGAGGGLSGGGSFGAAGNSRGALLLHHLTALNEQFAEWVAGQLVDKPTELWTDGINNYLEHAASVEQRFQDVLDGAAKPPMSSRLEFPPASSAPSFGAAAEPPARSVVKRKPAVGDADAPPAKSPFAGISLTAGLMPAAPAAAFPAPATTAAAAAPGPLFGGTSAAPAGTTPLFGSAAAVPAPVFGASTSASLFGSTTTPLFGGSAAAPGTGAGIFGGGGAAGPLKFNLDSASNPFAAPAAGGGLAPLNTATPAGEDNDDVEPPPSPTKVDRSGNDETFLMECKSKMLIKAPSGWKDMGTGNLSLRKANGDDGKAPVRIVMANNVGKFTLNANLYKGLKLQPVKGQPKQVSCALFNAECKDEDAKKTAQLILLRFGTIETANKFTTLVETNTPA